MTIVRLFIALLILHLNINCIIHNYPTAVKNNIPENSNYNQEPKQYYDNDSNYTAPYSYNRNRNYGTDSNTQQPNYQNHNYNSDNQSYTTPAPRQYQDNDSNYTTPNSYNKNRRYNNNSPQNYYYNDNYDDDTLTH